MRVNLPAILAHHDDDIVMFDVPPPLQSRGVEEYKKTWDLFFKYHKPSPQTFDIEELAITAGEDVAFAVAIMRCVSDPPEEGGFLFRLTIGFRKIDGAWRVTHEHYSVPATEGGVLDASAPAAYLLIVRSMRSFATAAREGSNDIAKLRNEANFARNFKGRTRSKASWTSRARRDPSV